MNPHKANLACAALLAALIVTPVTLYAQSTSAQSGFLPDYSQLKKAGLPTMSYMVYRAPALAGYAGKAVYVTPSAPYPANTVFPQVTDDVAKGTFASFDAQLLKQLAKKGVRVVATREEADLVLEVVLTQLASEEKPKKVVDLVPARAVMNVAKDAALGDALVAVTTLEAKTVDARTGQLLAELMQKSPGKGIGRTDNENTKVTLESLQPAVANSAELVVQQMLP